MKNYLLGITILNWNNAVSTIVALKTIVNALANAKFEYDIVVVENGSSEEQKNLLIDSIRSDSNLSHVQIRLNDTNEGYGGGMNSGVAFLPQRGHYDYYWLLNNDVLVDDNCFSNLFDYVTRNQNKKVIGITSLDLSRNIQCAGGCRYFSWFGIEERNQAGTKLSQIDRSNNSFDYIYGSALMVESQFFDETGGFDNTYFLYFEELSLAKQCQPSELGWCPDAILVHQQGSSELYDHRVKAFCVYHAALSCFRFTFSNYPHKIISVIFTRIIGKAIHAILRRNCDEFKAVVLAIKHLIKGKTEKDFTQLFS